MPKEISKIGPQPPISDEAAVAIQFIAGIDAILRQADERKTVTPPDITLNQIEPPNNGADTIEKSE